MFRKGLLFATPALLAALALFAGGPSLSGGAPSAGLDTEEQAFVDLINQYRQQNGLAPLSIDPSIQLAADWMSADMAAKNYFSHTDSLGRDPFVRMCDFGYCYNTWKGENILAGSSSAQVAFDWWKSSPGHNANMLKADFRVMGISRAYGPNSGYGWYWTNDFAGYLPPAPSPSPPAACLYDTDCDGWPDSAEIFIGTSPHQSCNQTATPNDEATDAWPPDFNDDRRVDLRDAISFAGVFGARSSDGRYDRRWDLNADSRIDLPDVIQLIGSWERSC